MPEGKRKNGRAEFRFKARVKQPHESPKLASGPIEARNESEAVEAAYAQLAVAYPTAEIRNLVIS